VRRIAPLALVLLSSAVARADEPAGLPHELHEAPATGSTLPVPATDIVFEGTTADKRLTGRFGVVWGDRLFGDFKLSAPVSDSGDPVTVATIDGLSAGTSAEASIAIVNWHPTADLQAQDQLCAATLLPDAQKKLQEYKPPSFVCSVTSLPPAKSDEFIKNDAAGQNEMCVAYRKQLEAEERKKLQDDIDALQRGVLPRGAGKAVVCSKKILPAKDRAAFDAATNYGTPLIAGIRLKADEKNFKYFDPSTYESKKRKGVNLSAGAYFGIILDGVGTFSGLFRYEHSYKEGDKSTVCVPGTVTGSLLCNDLAKGLPKASNKVIVAISFQRTLFGHLGVVGRAGGDIANNLVMFELPVYFIQSKDTSFTGGVVFSTSGKVTNDATAMDNGWTNTALVFLGGRFDALGVNTTWH
jgi:hypothetical protein